MEAETQRAMLEEMRDLHADLVAWRHQDEMERRADRERTTVERFEQIEGNQAKILGLLRKIDRGDDRRLRGAAEGATPDTAPPGSLHR